MSKRRWYVFLAALACTLLAPAIAVAEEAAAEGAAGPWDVPGKAIAGGLAIGLAAIGAGYAQGKIGSAGQGTLAERPEERIWVITLTALPEIIVLLGFVMAILIAQG